jgi:hypothetical protein
MHTEAQPSHRDSQEKIAFWAVPVILGKDKKGAKVQKRCKKKQAAERCKTDERL